MMGLPLRIFWAITIRPRMDILLASGPPGSNLYDAIACTSLSVLLVALVHMRCSCLFVIRFDARHFSSVVVQIRRSGYHFLESAETSQGAVQTSTPTYAASSMTASWPSPPLLALAPSATGPPAKRFESPTNNSSPPSLAAALAAALAARKSLALMP